MNRFAPRHSDRMIAVLDLPFPVLLNGFEKKGSATR